MTTSIQAYANEINQHHAQAQHHAGKAIDHAKAAGEVLLKAKAQLEHGQFLAWLAANCEVSPRQAQRYMGVAQGKPLPIRAIKNDTVSHLAAPSFMPRPEHWGVVFGDGEWYVIEPSAPDPGYWFVSRIYSGADYYDCTKRGIIPEAVGEFLQHLGMEDPRQAKWHFRPSSGSTHPLAAIGTVDHRGAV